MTDCMAIGSDPSGIVAVKLRGGVGAYSRGDSGYESIGPEVLCML